MWFVLGALLCVSILVPMLTWKEQRTPLGVKRSGRWRMVLILTILVVAVGLGIYGISTFDRSQSTPAKIAQLQNLRVKIQELRGQSKYAEAIDVARGALTLAEQCYSDRDPKLAYPIDDLASVLRHEQKFDEAESLFQRALSIRQGAYGERHAQVANSLDKLGELKQAQTHFDEAEALFKRSLDIREHAEEPNRFDLARSLNKLGQLSRDQNKATEAEQFLTRAEAMWGSSIGEIPSDRVESLINLANLYKSQDHSAKAEPLLKQALWFTETTLGKKHETVLGLLKDLADVCKRLGKKDDVLQYEERIKSFQSAN